MSHVYNYKTCLSKMTQLVSVYERFNFHVCFSFVSILFALNPPALGLTKSMPARKSKCMNVGDNVLVVVGSVVCMDSSSHQQSSTRGL